MRKSLDETPAWPPSAHEMEVRVFGSVTRVTIPSHTSRFVNFVCLLAGFIAVVAIARIFVPDRFVPESRFTERGSAVMIAIIGLIALARLFAATRWWVFELEAQHLSVHEFHKTRQPRTVVNLQEFADARYSDENCAPRLEVLKVGDQRGQGFMLVDNSAFTYRRLDMIRVARWIRDELRAGAQCLPEVAGKGSKASLQRTMLSYRKPPDPTRLVIERFENGIRITVPSIRSTSDQVAAILVSLILGFLGVGMLVSLYVPTLVARLGVSVGNSSNVFLQTVIGLLLSCCVVLPFAKRRTKFVVLEHLGRFVIVWNVEASSEERKHIDLTDITSFELRYDESTPVLVAVASQLHVENEVYRFAGGFPINLLQEAVAALNRSIEVGPEHS